MNVLSLFNGVSCGMMALEEIGIKVNKYYSSEIDKYANQATQAIFPNVIQLGDVTNWRNWGIDWSRIDLVTGGFPCQAWSMAGKQLGDKDERGMLFWVMLDIMKHVKCHNPKADFLIENVKMKKEFEEYITTHTENALGKVYKILINSALVSAQNRNRYYWTSFEVTQPEDKGILLKDIIEVGNVAGHTLSEKAMARIERKKYSDPQIMPDKTGTINTKNNSGQLSIDKGTTLIPLDGCIKTHGEWKPKVDKSQYIDANYHKGVDNHGQRTMIRREVTRATVQKNAEHTYNGKCPTITASMGIGGGNVPLMTDSETAAKFKGKYIDKDDRLHYRKLTPRECFRLQTVPEHHIDTLLSAGISNTQLYKMCGNGWTVDVIAHIFRAIPSEVSFL